MGPPRDDHIVTPSQTPVNAHIATLSPARANKRQVFACSVACPPNGASAEPFDTEYCFITTRPRDPLCPVCQARASVRRVDRSAGAAAIRCFNGLPLKLCSVSRRPHGSDSLPERRFRISRRLTVLRSRAFSARCEFYPLWVWLFHSSALMFARQRGLLFFSLWLTARTTYCPSTLKKGASQSKSLLNDRVRSLFGSSLEPLLSSGRQLPPLLLLPAPRRFLPLSRQPFSPLAPLVFSTARFRRVFFVFLYAGVIGGLCRRAALPVRTLPPAGSARRSALLFHPSALRPSAWSLSRPSARMSTPPMVLFSERQPHANFFARAPASMLNKQDPPRCFMSSTASRVNSRPHPLPGCLFHLSVLNDYLARAFSPARRLPY